MTTLPFLPSRNGLHYPNSWPHLPALTVATPFGSLPIGDAANGLCGGMAFAVADLVEASDLPPSATTTPDPASPAFAYVVSRLLDSFDLPAGVAQFYLWLNLPAHDTWLTGHGIAWRTIRDELPKVRVAIDAGHPCPLGLVQVHSTNPADLGRNHQVLAYGYDDAGPRTTLRIYDPNCPDDDGVTIAFDTSRPDGATEFVHSRRSSPPVLGFFTTHYTPKDPAPLFSVAPTAALAAVPGVSSPASPTPRRVPRSRS